MVDQPAENKPRFKIQQELDAPEQVVESGRLRIVGYEQGRPNKFLRGKTSGSGWVYWALDVCGRDTAPAFAVSEEELEAWNPAMQCYGTEG